LTQLRLYLTSRRPRVQEIYAALEAAFEEDGLPLALVEIDEDAGIDEISVYAGADEADVVEARIRAVAGADGPALMIARETLPDIDWVAKSLEGLKAVRAGGFVVHGAHEREEAAPGEIAIEIEAGLAFGTGHHGTTAACLEMLASLVPARRPANALDLGTGSAVLAIAIARLAPIPVLATDIDPVAVAVAADNVALNGVSAHVTTQVAAGFDDPVFALRSPFELIVANILAGPLIELAPQMRSHLAPGGALVLSGILERQHDAVVAAYEAQGLRRIATLHREGWVAIRLE
jgi:ribosomal protein L11 methyltransferase